MQSRPVWDLHCQRMSPTGSGKGMSCGCRSQASRAARPLRRAAHSCKNGRILPTDPHLHSPYCVRQHFVIHHWVKRRAHEKSYTCACSYIVDHYGWNIKHIHIRMYHTCSNHLMHTSAHATTLCHIIFWTGREHTPCSNRTIKRYHYVTSILLFVLWNFVL